MREIKIAFAIIIVIFFTVMLYEVWPFLHALGMGIYYVAWFTLGVICLALLAWVGRLLIPLFEKTVDKTIDLQAQRAAIEREQAELRLKFHLTRYAMSTQAHIEIDGVKVTQVLPPQTRVIEEKEAPKQIEAPAVQRPLSLPPAYDMLSIYKQFDIAPDSLFLAKDGYGEFITTECTDLCHGVFNAMTGGGKTSCERDLISQLLCVGATVILADLKFAPVTENGLDWRPLAKKMLAQEPLQVDTVLLPCLLRKLSDIAMLLHWLATTEIDRRLNMRVRGDFSYQTYFVFVEELIALLNIHPEAAADITRIVVLGRELRLYLFTAAQNFLVKDTKLSGGARENFQTAYFLGGDEHSGALILDMGKKQLGDYLRNNNVTLGKGVGMLRNNVSVPTASLVRLGWASNESVYYLHGRADDFILPDVGTSGKRESTWEWHEKPKESNPYMHPAVKSSSYAQQGKQQIVTGELVNPHVQSMKQPIEPSPVDGESSMSIPPDERLQIITIAKVQLKKEGKVIRNEIPGLMSKNNRYYSVVKQVLDEEGL